MECVGDHIEDYAHSVAMRWTLPIDTAALSIFHQFHQPPSLPVRSTGDAHGDNDEQTISR